MPIPGNGLRDNEFMRPMTEVDKLQSVLRTAVQWAMKRRLAAMRAMNSQWPPHAEDAAMTLAFRVWRRVEKASGTPDAITAAEVAIERVLRRYDVLAWGDPVA